VHLSDGQDRSAQINDARAVPLLSAALCLTRVGPPPVLYSSFHLSPAAMCHSPTFSSVVLVALPSPTIHSLPAACTASFPHPFTTQRRVHFPVFFPSTCMSSAMVHPPHSPTPLHLPRTMTSALVLMPVSRDIQLFQVAAREVIRIPKR
jgi:hypothetical protein